MHSGDCHAARPSLAAGSVSPVMHRPSPIRRPGVRQASAGRDPADCNRCGTLLHSDQLDGPREHRMAAVGPITVTVEALNAAGAMSLRMFTLFLTSMAYILTTDPRELVAELTRRLRIPYRFAFGVSAALTFIPLLEEEGTHILAAQQVRGHRPPKGLGSRIGYGLKFVSAVLLNALRRVQQTAGAMESKDLAHTRTEPIARRLTSLHGRSHRQFCMYWQRFSCGGLPKLLTSIKEKRVDVKGGSVQI